MPLSLRPRSQPEECLVQPRWSLARRWLVLLLLPLGLTAHGAAPARPSDSLRTAFVACDARAFLALNMARNYLMTDRNKDLVLPFLRDDAAAQAMADELFRRVDANEIRHPGQFAADILQRCATEQKLNVGAPRALVATCFVRTDIAFFLHTHRSEGVKQGEAISKVLTRLKSRALYPAALVTSTSDAVYKPLEPPDLRQLMSAMAWSCIGKGRGAATSPASAASR
jgi:hypothetical protein